MKTSSVITVSLISFCLGFIFGVSATYKEPMVGEHQEPPKIVLDSVFFHDTTFVRNDIYVVKTDTVEIPITKHHFDTIIKEVHVGGIVEGWHPSLDSLTIDLPEPIYIKDTRKFSIGPQFGVGFNGEFSPYIGIGVTYNLFNF